MLFQSQEKLGGSGKMDSTPDIKQAQTPKQKIDAIKATILEVKTKDTNTEQQKADLLLQASNDITTLKQELETSQQTQKFEKDLTALDALILVDPEQIKSQLLALQSSQDGKERGKIVANLLDGPIPFDVIAGFIPVIGDLGIGTASFLYYAAEAMKAGGNMGDIAKMFGWQAVDGIVGSIPLVGDIFDYFFKANKKNAKILENIHSKNLKNLQKTYGLNDEQLLTYIKENKTLSGIGKGVGMTNKVAKIATKRIDFGSYKNEKSGDKKMAA